MRKDAMKMLAINCFREKEKKKAQAINFFLPFILNICA